MKHARFVPVRNCVLALSVAALLSTSAIGADLGGPSESYKDAPAIVGVPNWAGFYAGGHIGGGWSNGDGQSLTVQGGNGGGGGGGGGDNNWLNSASQAALKNGADGKDGNDGGAGGRGGNVGHFPAPNPRLGGNGGTGGAGGEVTGEGDDGDGVIGGFHLGYNWQRDDIVFGVEGDASFDGGLDNYLASLRARIGMARGDAFFYLTGGLAIRDGGEADAIGLASNGGAGGKGGQNDDGIDDGPSEATHPATRGGLGGNGGAPGTPTVTGFGGGDNGSDTGVVVGTGVEYMLSSNVSAGVEGLWYSFGDDQDMTVLRARLSFHLNGLAHESFKDSYASAAIANWSGFYVGGNAGVGFGNGKRADSIKTANGKSGSNGGNGAVGNANPIHGNFPASEGIDDPGGAGGGGGGGSAALISLEDDSGALAGVHLGYNWQSDARVFGIEGDANWADQEFRDYLASVRLRLGHAFDQVLVYGTAGVAFARSAEGIASVSLTSGGAGGQGDNGQLENDPYFPGHGGTGGAGGTAGVATVTHGGGEDKVGFVVGGGFEVKLWERTSLGLEGLYYGFDGGNAVSTSSSYDAGDELSSAVVRGRLTFHLDGDHDSLK
jgi:opacity protein-like surface antigen